MLGLKTKAEGLHLFIVQQDNVFSLGKTESPGQPTRSGVARLPTAALSKAREGSAHPGLLSLPGSCGPGQKGREPAGQRVVEGRSRLPPCALPGWLARLPYFLASLPGPGKRRKEQPKCTTSRLAGKPPPPPPPPPAAFPRQGHLLPGFFDRCHLPPLQAAEGQAAPSFRVVPSRATLRRPLAPQRRPRGLPLLALHLLPAGQSGPASSHPPPCLQPRVAEAEPGRRHGTD